MALFPEPPCAFPSSCRGKLPTLREHLRMAQAAQQGSKAEKPKASEQPGKDPGGSMKR